MKKVALSALVIAASGAYVWSQAGASDPMLSGADLQTGSIQPQNLDTSATMDVAPRVAPFVTRETAPVAPAPAPAAAAGAQALPPLPAPGEPSAPAPAAPVAVAALDVPAMPASDTAPAPVATAFAAVPMPRLRPPYRQVAAVAPTPAPASAPSTAAAPLVRVAANATGLNDGTFRGPVVDAYYGLMQIEAVVQNGRLATIHVLRWPNDRRTSVFINRQALPMLRDEVISAQSANVNIISGATLSSEAFIQSLGAALDKARL